MALYARAKDVPPLLRHGVEEVTADHVRDHNLLVRIIPRRCRIDDIGFNALPLVREVMRRGPPGPYYPGEPYSGYGER